MYPLNVLAIHDIEVTSLSHVSAWQCHLYRVHTKLKTIYNNIKFLKWGVTFLLACIDEYVVMNLAICDMHILNIFFPLLLHMTNWNVRVVKLSWHIMEHNISHTLMPASFSCGAIHLHKWDCGLQIMEFLYFLWWKPFLCHCCIRNAGLWYKWKLYLRK